MIWLVLGSATILNIILPLALTGKLNIPATVIYAVIIFPYLLWLGTQANKCTAAPPPLPASYQ
jgi:hypothetical protein